MYENRYYYLLNNSFKILKLFLNNLLLLLNGYILKNIVPKFINNVYKFSDELLSIYKFRKNFGKKYTIKFSIKKIYTIKFEKKFSIKKYIL